jgi:hypothetical protein
VAFIKKKINFASAFFAHSILECYALIVGFRVYPDDSDDDVFETIRKDQPEDVCIDFPVLG